MVICMISNEPPLYSDVGVGEHIMHSEIVCPQLSHVAVFYLKIPFCWIIWYKNIFFGVILFLFFCFFIIAITIITFFFTLLLC